MSDNTMTTTETTTIPKKEPKKRATVEYNGMELVLALLVLYDDINTYGELLQKIQDMKENPGNYILTIHFNDPNLALGENDDLKNYLADIVKKESIVNSFISRFRNLSLKETLHGDKIKHIYISGKKNKHTKIDELNKGYDSKAAKADIYIEYTDEDLKIIGVSVKQSKDATKSNYSVQKMLGPEANTLLTQIKKQFLKDQGYEKFDKDIRKEVNELFYPVYAENPYWIAVRQLIEQQKESVVQQLIQHMGCGTVPYPIYEFDGEKIYLLNITSNSSTGASAVTFEDHLPYYSDSKGKQRHAAKLFYRLAVNTKIYRVEVRWKGNIHNSSPQFQIHEE